MGYLRPALERRNLAVLTGAQATRVVFEGSRAVGVEFYQGRDSSQRMVVRATREVIYQWFGTIMYKWFDMITSDLL